MLRHLLFLVVCIFIVTSIAWGADKPAGFTQKEFARLILKQLEWDSGLPKEPADRDYLVVLGGKRTFRYEAENAYNPVTDRVTVRNFPLYGEFTGSGWILGTSDITSTTFTVLLPIGGEYELKSVLKGNGFVWNINGKNINIDTNSAKLKEVEITRLTLKGGTVTIKVTIPPEGAIDSFSLTAPDYVPVQPLSGWRFKEEVTAQVLAETATALANSYGKLPDEKGVSAIKTISVTELIKPVANTTLSDALFLGRFTSANWLRADFRGAVIQLPLVVDEKGYYRIVSNIMGDKITGTVNGTQFSVNGEKSLKKTDFGLFRLESGSNQLIINLPPNSGIDTVELQKKRTAAPDFLELSGVKGPAGRTVGADEAVDVLKKIRENNKLRN